MKEAKFHTKYVPPLGRDVKFCDDCGEYVYSEYIDEKDNMRRYVNICSNPFCPEVMQ